MLVWSPSGSCITMPKAFPRGMMVALWTGCAPAVFNACEIGFEHQGTYESHRQDLFTAVSRNTPHRQSGSPQGTKFRKLPDKARKRADVNPGRYRSARPALAYLRQHATIATMFRE